MASNRSFSMIQRRISLSPLPASPENMGDPLKTIPMRLPPFSGAFILEIRCCRNKKEPSEIRGKPAPKRPLWPYSQCLLVQTSGDWKDLFSHIHLPCLYITDVDTRTTEEPCHELDNTVFYYVDLAKRKLLLPSSGRTRMRRGKRMCSLTGLTLLTRPPSRN